MLLKIMQLAILPFCHQIKIRANKRGPEEDSDAVDRNKVIQGFFFFFEKQSNVFQELGNAWPINFTHENLSTIRHRKVNML